MAKVYLSLGSNKGDRLDFLKSAIFEIHKNIGSVVFVSDVFETESWNYNDKDYLNLVLEIKTFLTPKQVLDKCRQIEMKLGRENKTVLKNGKPIYLSRKIDIDILFFDEIILNTKELKIPHNKLHLRNFVLKPLNQISKDFIHPVLQQNIYTLYNRCEDKGKIKLYKKINLEDIIIQ